MPIATNLLQIKEFKNSYIKMAVSYVHNSGVAILKNVNLRPTDVLISADHHMSDPNAIMELKNMGAQIRIFIKPRFHAKIYIITTPEKKKIAIIGSSNLSQGGWEENIECNLITEGRDLISEIETLFESLKDRSTTLESFGEEYLQKWLSIFNNFKNASIKSKQQNNELLNSLEQVGTANQKLINWTTITQFSKDYRKIALEEIFGIRYRKLTGFCYTTLHDIMVKYEESMSIEEMYQEFLKRHPNLENHPYQKKNPDWFKGEFKDNQIQWNLQRLRESGLIKRTNRGMWQAIKE